MHSFGQLAAVPRSPLPAGLLRGAVLPTDELCEVRTLSCKAFGDSGITIGYFLGYLFLTFSEAHSRLYRRRFLQVEASLDSFVFELYAWGGSETVAELR